MNRFCTACGKTLEPEAIFCGACGKQVKREDASSVGTPSGEKAAGGMAAFGSGKAASLNGDKTGGSPFARPLGSQPREPVEEPPESVFANTSTDNSEAAPEETSAVGVTPEADPAYYEEEHGGNDNRKYWIAGGVAAFLLLAILYYFLFFADDMGNSQGGRPTATPDTPAAEETVDAKLFYATSAANIRDKATTQESEILGKLKRGDEAKGKVIATEDSGDWLELENGEGFVFMANLSDAAMPTLAQNFGRKTISLAGPVDMYAAPSADAELLDRLSKGLTINISGITENDYAEVILRKGGVGYIANGAEVVKKGEAPKGPAIAIKLDVQRCASGSDIDALFKKLDGQYEAERKKIEEADYPNDNARDAAVDKWLSANEGKSRYLKAQRSFEGLQMTGIARHYESQSVYFADPPKKVREVFRKLGYKVAKDGTLDSRDISAGIYGTRNRGAQYGRSDLECGV